MIYNIYGDKRLPINLYSNYIDSAYNLIGNNIMHELLLKDEFDAFDTNVWGCRSGGYTALSIKAQILPRESRFQFSF